MKTAMRKSDSEIRTLARKTGPAQQKSGNGLQINDNRPVSIAQMKFIESLQKKEGLQRQPGPEEEELSV